MPFLRKPPPGRRRANLQIDYRFDRAAYTRWRLRRWGDDQLASGADLARRAIGQPQKVLATIRRRPGRVPVDGRYPPPRIDHTTPSARPPTASM